MKHFPAPVRRGKRLRKVAALTVGSLIAVGAVSTLTSPAANAAVGCSVTYAIDSSWNGAFQGTVKITNTGDALSNWTVGWTYANGQKITQMWNATYTQNGAAVTAKNMPYNGSLPSGQTANFGFLSNWSGANAIPTAFTVNGVACGPTTSPSSPSTSVTPTNQPPTVTLTSPAAGASFSAPGTVPLTVTAADPDGTVAKVEYYSDTTLIATATSSPFSASWTNVPAGSYSITAKATDDKGLSTTSTPAGITVATGPTIKVSPAAVSVAAGKTVSYTVALSAVPTSNVTVTTARAGGNTGLTVTTGGTLTFTPGNWNVPQTVTITAAASGTVSPATFTSS